MRQSHDWIIGLALVSLASHGTSGLTKVRNPTSIQGHPTSPWLSISAPWCWLSSGCLVALCLRLNMHRVWETCCLLLGTYVYIYTCTSMQATCTPY
ncbi:hypothetical protein V8C37DRAFT_311190 [Trichoderma ceciliae]